MFGRVRLIVLVVVVVVMGLVGESAQAASRAEVARRLEDFRSFFVDFQMAPDSGVPADLLSECHGVIIMRQYKAGFVFGVKGGDGVIFLHDRDTGAWSPPAFVTSAEGSFGFQIGGQAIDAIMLIMNREGVNMLLKSRFQVGVDASAAAGPVGRDAAAKVGPGTAILSYSRAKGLYAGVAFEGGALLNHDKYNRALYGMNIGVREILFNSMVQMPPEAQPMIDTLRSYAGVPSYQYAQPAPVEPIPVEPVPVEPVAAPYSSPPLPDMTPQTYSYVEPAAPVGTDQAALDAAAVEAARAAAAAEEAARAAKEAADAAAARAAAARGQ